MAARPRGQRGGVRKRFGKWYATYRTYGPEGKTSHEEPLTAQSKTEARGMAAEITKRLTTRRLVLGAPLEDIWERWAKRYEREGLSPQHVATQKGLWKNHLATAFGKMRIEDIKPEHIQAFFVVKRSRSQALKLRDLLAAMFDLAKEHGLIHLSPMADAHIRIEGREALPALTFDELRGLMKRMKGEDLIKLLLFSVCGVDKSAARALRRNDITPEGLRIDEGYVDGKLTKLKTARRRAVIPLPANLAAMLAKYAADTEEWLFPARHGAGPWDADAWVAEALRPAAARAGIAKHVDLRMLRRTASTLMLLTGAPSLAAAGVLRNSPEVLERVYANARNIDEQRAALAGVMDRLKGGRVQ